MKAKLVGSMTVGTWIYEIKFDGYHALALRAAVKRGSFRETKRTLEANSQPSEIRLLHSMSRMQSFDGEIVALGERGRSPFQLLQDFAQEKAPIVYYAFDLFRLNDRNLQALPIEERKA